LFIQLSVTKKCHEKNIADIDYNKKKNLRNEAVTLIQDSRDSHAGKSKRPTQN